MASPHPGCPRTLNWFAWFTAAATLGLICVGGLVTSHGAGLAVPDWPNTYGYNMFFFPVSQWVGGIFYEHTHRLAASAVGLLTTVLAVWLWLAEPRRWVRWLGIAAFVGVILQGVLGGLRVTLIKDELGILHATIAQLFLVLVSAIALLTSPIWHRAATAPAPSRPLLKFVCLVCTLILAQLILGATMRHQHAGLAVPDFPLAYGRLWPSTAPDAIAFYNQNRIEARAANPITAGQVLLHMAHRLGAVAVLLGIAGCAWRARRELGHHRPFTRACLAWLGLGLLQVALGAITVWSNKAADLTTAHVAGGATTLVLGSMLALWAARASLSTTRAMRLTSPPHTPVRPANPTAADGARTAPA